VVVAEGLRREELHRALLASAEFSALHQVVHEAVTVPRKRAAIRAALSWMEREHNIRFDD